VIAEIGVNHNGDVHLAHRLIDLAVKAGADAVKFQTFHTDGLVTTYAPKARYQAVQTGNGNQRDMLSRLELSAEDFRDLYDHAEKLGVDFISTAFDPKSLEEVVSLNPKCLKWPSGELNNFPLLRQAALTGLPIIISTGMADIGEVAATLDYLNYTGISEVAILQCVSSYPASIEEQNLRCIATMSEMFRCPTGFSDHTLGPWAALAARSLGMAILEKHVTLDRSMEGPDHAASMEPHEFSQMVAILRQVEDGLGDGVKRPAESELATRIAARKSLVYATSLPAGHILEETDIAAKRPSGGLDPDQMGAVIGRRLAHAVKANQQVIMCDVE